MFAHTPIRHLEEVEEFFGTEEVVFYSQDNKAKVHIGMTVASKQASLLVHVDCKVNIPDHDFVIEKQHKLVPLFIGDTKMKAKIFSSDAFTYSRPFFIGI